MEPVVARGDDRLGVPALLNELLHARHRLLREHVQQEPDDGRDEDDCDRDRHCCCGFACGCCGVPPPPAALVVCVASGGGTAPGSTMYERIVFEFPSY